MKFDLKQTNEADQSFNISNSEQQNFSAQHNTANDLDDKSNFKTEPTEKILNASTDLIHNDIKNKRKQIFKMSKTKNVYSSSSLEDNNFRSSLLKEPTHVIVNNELEVLDKSENVNDQTFMIKDEENNLKQLDEADIRNKDLFLTKEALSFNIISDHQQNSYKEHALESISTSNQLSTDQKSSNDISVVETEYQEENKDTNHNHNQNLHKYDAYLLKIANSALVFTSQTTETAYHTKINKGDEQSLSDQNIHINQKQYDLEHHSGNVSSNWPSYINQSRIFVKTLIFFITLFLAYFIFI